MKAILFLFLLAPVTALSAEKPWFEVQSPHFTVVSNGGDKTARRLAAEFEQAKNAFVKAMPGLKAGSGKPFVVLAARDEASLRELAPRFWESKDTFHPIAVYQRGADRDWIALRTDVEHSSAPDENPYSSGYEGVAFMALEASYHGALPPWFQYGLKIVLGNTLVKDDVVEVGRLVKWRVREISHGRVRVPDLIQVEWKSPVLTDEDKRREFDCSAWMTVHYLLFADNGSHASQMDAYAQALSRGVDPKAAFTQAFGDAEALDSAVANYFGRSLYSYARIPADATVKAEAFSSRTLTNSDSLALRAGFLAASHSAAAARVMLDAARREDPNVLGGFEVEGLLLDQEGKTPEAIAAYEKAMAGGSKLFMVYERLAMQLWGGTLDNDTLAKIVKVLERGLEIQPESAIALSWLGVAKARLVSPKEGLPFVTSAVKLEPRNARFHVNLASVLANAGDWDQAQAEAGRALSLATADQDKRDARDLLARFGEAKNRAAAPAALAATTASSTHEVQHFVCDETNRKDCELLVRMNTEGCDRGIVEDCGMLGYAYERALGVSRDLKRAVAAYDKACDGGMMPACLQLGMLRARGPAEVHDDRAARVLMRKACDGGERSGCTQLAVILISGTTQEKAEGTALLKKACAAGETYACSAVKQIR